MEWATNWRINKVRSLIWKLGGALLLVVAVSVGLTAFLVSQSTTSEFRQYLSRCDAAYIQVVEDNLLQLYARDKSWTGVQETLNSQIRSQNDRLVFADSSGTIIGDTAGDWLGKNIKEIGLDTPLPVTISGKVVGNLYLMYYGSIDGNSHMMMNRGCMGGAAALNVADENFLNRVNSYLWLAGLIAAVVALLLGLFLTRQIILPIRALTKGAHQIAEGKLNYKVKSSSKDELGELAQSFNSMASSLDKMEQSRRRLTADIAHELRTPLTIIEGTVDAMLDGVFKPDKEHLSSIKEQTSQLTHLINDLREISLAESGQLKLDITPTDIVNLVRRKLSQAEVKALNKGIKLKLDVHGTIPEVKVDSARIEQVITNLLTNAIRHTPSGGEITVSLETVKEDNIYQLDKPSLLISVTDTGEGILPEHLPSIFDRFYRVESSRSKNEGETGLGLAIVKQMVEAHRGKVWVESELGKGSKFHIAIPLVEDKQA
jgi:signal transduction histidine kinase